MVSESITILHAFFDKESYALGTLALGCSNYIVYIEHFRQLVA
jgi:hypothetical protein